jgi:Flp pilus assembly protein CpaB
MKPSRFLDSLRRAFRWHRRAFAALLVALSVLAGVNALSQRDSTAVPVVVAARTIAGGADIVPADLTLAHLPSSAVAEGAVSDPQRLVGRTVVAEVPVRRVLTASDLLGEAGGLAPGTVALPVRFGESATISLLRVGARIDILGPSAEGSGYAVVAGDVRVAAIPKAPDEGVLGGGGSDLVLIEVTNDQATRIASSASVSDLSFALR